VLRAGSLLWVCAVTLLLASEEEGREVNKGLERVGRAL